MGTVKLQDVHGTYFSVELNWAYLPGEFECFLLGIREAGERETRPQPASGDGTGFALKPFPQLYGTPSESQSTSSLPDSSALSTSRSPPSVGSDGEAKAVAFACVA